MADAKIVNIKGVQWDLKDEVARNKIIELETLVNKLKADTEVTELDNIVLGSGVTFVGTVIKVGKQVTVSGALIVAQGYSPYVISKLPINKSASNKDSIIVWTNYSGQNLGLSIASFDKGADRVSIPVGMPSSYPALGQLSFSYVTE